MPEGMWKVGRVFHLPGPSHTIRLTMCQAMLAVSYIRCNLLEECQMLVSEVGYISHIVKIHRIQAKPTFLFDADMGHQGHQLSSTS